MERRIFKKNSTSFYAASRLFPKEVKKDVFGLYSFLRIADDYVDETPIQPDKLNELIELWEKSKHDDHVNNAPDKSDSKNQRVVKNIVRLSTKYNFDPRWIDSFLLTMKSDLSFQPKITLANSLEYCYGSAEVVGLMMSRILGLSKDLDEQAKLLGRSFQWINFVRDIDEDTELGRCYFPAQELKNFNLKGVDFESAQKQRTLFKDFIEFQIQRYESWVIEAKKAFPFVPKRQRIALEVAVDLYDWTAKQILKNPMIVFEKKVKPKKSHKTIFVLNRSARVYFK